MKICISLQTTEDMQTDLTPEEAGGRLEAAIGTRFKGSRDGEAFRLTNNDRNVFRPELTIRLRPEDGGTAISVGMQLHPILTGFLLVWTLVFVGLAIWRGLLMLVLLPFVWAGVIMLFSLGVKNAKESLSEVLEAYEIID